MDYNIIITENAENELDRYIRYLLFEIRSEQAARNLPADFEETVQMLKSVAGRLKEQGYKIIKFKRHGYFMLFRVEENDVIVDALFHELQDYENKIE